MRFLMAVVLACGVLTASVGARAACDDLVVDEVGILSDASKVTAVARKLGNDGADVRVRIVKSLGVAQNLDDYEAMMQKQCTSWQSNGHRKSTMLIVMYAPSSHEAGVYYGAQHSAKLGPVWAKIRSDSLRPAIVAYQNGEKNAYTNGFTTMLENFGQVLRVSNPSGGPMTIVNTQPNDHSWVWKSFLILALVVGGLGGGAYYLFIRQTTNAAQGVRAQTQRVRAGCLNRLLTITDPSKISELRAMVLATKTRLSAVDAETLQTALRTFEKQGSDALAAFSRFDGVDQDDPNTSGLPASVYQQNQQAYEDIIASSIEPAEASLKQISETIGAVHQLRVAS